MQAGSWELARRLAGENVEAPDVMLLSDYVDVPALYGHLPPDWAGVPAVLYFHENQLTYPVRPRESGPKGQDADVKPDHHFGMTNILSCLRARRVVFNSRFHLEDFGRAARALLATLPRPRPLVDLEESLADARIVSPGIDLDEIELGAGPPAAAPLRVLFPHRADHDKDPQAFLAAALGALDKGAAMEFVCLGEKDGSAFDALPAEVVVHRGRLESRSDYALMLGSCDLVVSTATHDFFGIAVAEAMAAGCAPLLPNRLNYPDLVGEALKQAGLYGAGEDLADRLALAAREPKRYRDQEQRARMRETVAGHSADRVTIELDALLEEASP